MAGFVYHIFMKLSAEVLQLLNPILYLQVFRFFLRLIYKQGASDVLSTTVHVRCQKRRGTTDMKNKDSARVLFMDFWQTLHVFNKTKILVEYSFFQLSFNLLEG